MIAIFANSMEGGFGYEGRLPWPKIKEDMEHFRNVTHGNFVVMGRNTYNTLPSLPYRTPIVVTNRPLDSVLWLKPDCLVANIKQFEKRFKTEVVIIGGSSLLTPEILQNCSVVYHTLVKGVYPHDVAISDDTLLYLSQLKEEVLVSTELCTIRKLTNENNS
jgi:dihydrofolate reductase